MNKIISASLLLLLASCASQSEKNKLTTIDKPDYSVNYPAEWENQNKQGLEFLVSTALDGKDDQFADNFNLLKQDLSTQPMTLAQFDSISKAQTITALGENAILDSKTVGDHCVVQFKGQYEGRPLKWKQNYYIKNNTAYILTYTAEEKSYDKYAEQAEAIFNSFKLK